MGKDVKTVSLCGGDQCCPELILFPDGSGLLREGSWSLELSAVQIECIRSVLSEQKARLEE